MRAKLDLKLLLVFEAIDATRSVSKAAARLGSRQSVVSASLARLREIFGDPLFVRAAGAMQPTPRALRVAGSVSTALAALRKAMLDVPWLPSEAERIFTIASTDYTTLVLLPTVMEAIEREAPSVNLRVIGYDKNDIAELIDRGEIDMALGVFQTPPATAVRQLLCEERFVGIARKGHPKIRSGSVSLNDYVSAAHALVSVRRDASGAVDVALTEHGLCRRIAITLPHMLALRPILARTDLLAALPGRIGKIFVGTDLQTFDIPLRLAPWRIEMLWNPSSRNDGASAWLRTKILHASTAQE